MCIFAADFGMNGLPVNSGRRYAIKKRENRCPRNSRYYRDIENPNY